MTDPLDSAMRLLKDDYDDDVIDPSHLTEEEFYNILSYGSQEQIDEAIRRRDEERWQQKNAGEPMDIAVRLLKSPLVLKAPPPQPHFESEPFQRWGRNLRLGNLNRLLVPDPAKNLDRINPIGFTGSRPEPV